MGDCGIEIFGGEVQSGDREQLDGMPNVLEEIPFAEARQPPGVEHRVASVGNGNRVQFAVGYVQLGKLHQTRRLPIVQHHIRQTGSGRPIGYEGDPASDRTECGRNHRAILC